VPPLVHLTSCTPTKSNSYFDISFATVISEPALYRLLTFRVPYLMSIFFILARLSKESVQVPGPLWHFVTRLFFYNELLAPRPTPKLEDHPLSAICDCLFNILAATLHICGPTPSSATWWRALRDDKGPCFNFIDTAGILKYVYQMLRIDL
jgi:hypothetical protein